MSLLTKRRHSVVVAANGPEAVATCQGEPFDLIVMDVQMPDMDGFEATAAIRAQERTSGAHIPIIAMTARALKGDEERCPRAGMDGYVAKPVHAARLFEVIRHLVPAAQPTVSAAGAADAPEIEVRP